MPARSGASGEKPGVPAENGGRSGQNGWNFKLLTVLIVVGVLYFAREVLIPLALAVLLAFLLAPLVTRLGRFGLGRFPSVVGVVLLSFAILGVIGTILASQLTDLAHQLPGYQHNVHQKLESIRTSGGGVFNRLSRVIKNVSNELMPPEQGTAQNPNGEKPVQVEIHRSTFSPLQVVQKVLGSVLDVVVLAAVVIVFVIFMLIQKEDLRDRLIKLAGSRRLDVTTKVLDDAASRVSGYLLAQLAVNVGYGILVGVGLYFIGVPNPLMWGILAALLRYIPYVGVWIAAAMPAVVAFAVEPGWVKLPIVFGLFFGVDLFMYNFAEPVLYGSSTGVSPLGILVAAVFWTWLWGAAGLLLATPLTVCVVVLGRHVPNLEFLSIMLSDEPVLTPQTRFYQRMVAMDLDEATAIAEEFLKGKSLEDLYDEVVIPALTLAEGDRHCGNLDEHQQQFIFRNTRMLVEDLAERADELTGANGGSRSAASGAKKESTGKAPHPKNGSVLCLPARDEADELAALMLAQLLNRRGIGAKPVSAASLVQERLEGLGGEKPRLACVFAVPPFGYMHARYLCRRLRAKFEDVKLIAAILTERDVQEVRNRQPKIVADELASSLKQLVGEVASFIPA